MSRPDFARPDGRTISCPCGWSRFVASSIPAARRRQILAQHEAEAHPDKEKS